MWIYGVDSIGKIFFFSYGFSKKYFLRAVSCHGGVRRTNLTDPRLKTVSPETT